MSKNHIMFAQCRYRSGNKVDVTWIPNKFAKVGQKIYFGKKEQENPEVWTILEVWKKRPYGEIKEREKDWDKHRDWTDI